MLALCAVIAPPASAQAPLPEQVLTAPGYETVAGLIRTFDGGLLHIGSTTSFGAGEYDVYLLKMDSAENIEWIRSYGGALDDVGSQVRQLPDSGYLITAATKSFGMGAYDGYVIRTDAQGNILWQRVVGGPQDDVLSRAVVVDDTTFVFAGFSKSIGAGDADCWVMEMNDGGDTLWTKVFGGAKYDAIVTVNPASGGLIFSGRTATVSGLFFNALIFKTDFDANIQWLHVYGGPGSAEAMYIRETADQGFLATGASNSFAGGGNHDVFAVKTDSAGNLDWARLYGGANVDASYDILQNPDGGYTLVGFTESYNAITPRLAGPAAVQAGGDSANVFLVRIDAAGDTIWSRAIGGNQFDEGYNIVPWDTNGCLVSAYTASFSGSDTTDVFMIRVDGQGNAGCHSRVVHPVVTSPAVTFVPMTLSFASGLPMSAPATLTSSFSFGFSDPCFGVGVKEVSKEDQGMTVYPNPSTGRFSIRLHATVSSAPATIELALSDSFGRELLREKRKPESVLSVDAGNLAAGIYLVRIEGKGISASEKLVVVGE